MDHPTSLQSVSFQSLSQPIKEWLTSDRVFEFTGGLNQRLDLDGDGIVLIPRLVTRLVTGGLHPKNFVAELKRQIYLKFPEAQALAKEISDFVLAPVAEKLRKETGMDINDILPGEENIIPDEKLLNIPLIAPEVSRVRQTQESEAPPQEAEKLPEPPTSDHNRPPEPPAPPVGETGSDQPMIIHEEKPATEAVQSDETRQTFRIQGDVGRGGGKTGVTAKIEGPQARVVHYSDLRTPLNE